MNQCWILSNAFSASIEMIMWFLSFLLLMWCITLILHMLKHPCEFGMNPTWSWCRIFFMGCRIWCAKILLNFCIFIHQRYLPLFFFGGAFLWFWYQDDGGFHRMSLGVFPLSYFGKFWEGLVLVICLLEFISKALRTRGFLRWEIFDTDSHY